VCTIECCLRKLKLDYRQKCIISLIFHMLVIHMARLYFGPDLHLLRLGCSPEVHLARGHLMHLDTLWEESSSIFLFHSRHHHAAAASLPVNRCGHLAGGCELEAVNHSQDLVKVSPCCGWVEQRQLQPLVRANDEDCPAGKRDAFSVLLVGVHHSIQSSHLPFGVRNDRVGEASGQVVVCNDVLDPAIVAVHLVTAESNQLHSALCKIIAQHLNPAKLSGAHWSIVSRVGEEDGPAILDPAMEINVPLCGV